MSNLKAIFLLLLAADHDDATPIEYACHFKKMHLDLDSIELFKLGQQLGLKKSRMRTFLINDIIDAWKSCSDTSSQDSLVNALEGIERSDIAQEIVQGTSYKHYYVGIIIYNNTSL